MRRPLTETNMSAILSTIGDWVLPISNVATLILSLLFSTKIKDWFSGIPSDLRLGLKAAETATIAKVKAAQNNVIASVTPVPAPVLKPAEPAAPVAPVVLPPAA
jgi:hypothetical protein